MGILKIHLFLPSIDIRRDKYSSELPNQAVPMDGHFLSKQMIQAVLLSGYVAKCFVCLE